MTKADQVGQINAADTVDDAARDAGNPANELVEALNSPIVDVLDQRTAGIDKHRRSCAEPSGDSCASAAVISTMADLVMFQSAKGISSFFGE